MNNNRQLAIGTRQSTHCEVFETAYRQLRHWCLEHNLAGHDPFDGLNSQLFQATPLARSRTARFAWTQLLKRLPLDLRAVTGVPAERNAKGMALFALAQLSDHRRHKTAESEVATRRLLADLLSLQINGYRGAAWGYNFDWQSRNFFAPRGTATIVPTAFAARAFLEAATGFGDDQYLATARSVCDFILLDLPRSVSGEREVCFSYSPASDTRIFNASLLAAEVLAGVGVVTGEGELCKWAERAARYVVDRQSADGSWTYGTESSQSWTDNFHTAYILFSLARIIKAGSFETEFQQSLKRGYQYWKTNFFLAEGWPKYYHDDPYPAEAHSAASAIISFLELQDLDESSSFLAQDIASWAIRNLHDPRGFFYYQRRRFYTVRKSYMRWSQAWMLYALARLLEEIAIE